jgi:hypothetical protein
VIDMADQPTEPNVRLASSPEQAVDALRSIWSANATDTEDAAEAFGEAKVCRNMKDITFDGMAEPGSDLRDAWREKLRKEGKLSTGGGSIRDLVLGPDEPR